MNFTYLVLLKPSEIRFTKNLIASRFDNGIPLLETFTQIKNGEILIEDIPLIEVVFFAEKWEWYTLNNRRLWVLQELEKIGKCQYIRTKRIEYLENVFDYPSLLYGSAALKENTRSFTWRGDNLQITTRRTPSKDVDIYYEKDDKRSRFGHQGLHRNCRRARSDYNEGRFQQEHRNVYKMKHRRRCKRRRRFHPYSRNDWRDSRIRREDHESGRNDRRVVEVKSYHTERRSSMSSDYSGSEYGFQFSYTVWYRRRQAFLQSVYCIRTGRLRDPSRYIDVLYTCGVCFKSFKSKVSLNQHSEELFHWACVRCGRFFGSHTALGQHKLALNHTI